MDFQGSSKRPNSEEDFQKAPKRPKKTVPLKKKKVPLNKKKVPLKKSSNMPFVQKNVSEGGKDDISYYSSFLREFETVSEKMIRLRNLSSLKLQDIKDRHLLRFKILAILKPYYPHCQVLLFGSSCNGFGIMGSDLDILFLPFPLYCKSGEEQDEEKELPTPGQVRTDKVFRDSLAKMGEKEHLRFILCILQKFFSKAIMIPAKLPILSFVAQGKHSQICCDLSCRNKLVVYNTSLLCFITRIDKRVHPLVNTLRFWAKAMGFLGVPGLSSYAFTLLVIFFLQNTRPSVLPSVNYLMQLSESSRSVAGWDVSFTQNLDLIPKSENQDAEGVLLQKFFLFYWNFDFTRNTVCVRTGRVLPIEDLKNENIEGFEISPMCIQDPFKLSHNIGKNVQHSCLSLFKPSLYIASSILPDDPDCELSEDTFLMLFDKQLFNSKINSEFYFLDSKNLSAFLIPLNHKIIAALGDGKDVLKRFYEKASLAVYNILEYGFLMECDIIDRSSFISISRNQNEKKVRRDSNCLLTIQCFVYNRTWMKRKITPAPTEFDSNAEEFGSIVLKTEYAISNSIISLYPHLSCPYPILYFLCRCYIPDYSQIPYLIVETYGPMPSKEFTQVQKFLKTKLPETVTQLLLENNPVK